VWLFQLLGGQAESGVVHVLLPSPDVVEGKPMDAHVISRSAHAVVLRSTAVGPPIPEQPPPVTLTSSAVSKAVDDALFAVFGEQPEDSGRKRPRPD
jgi:hypothetical protein